ncbi:MAG: T9SS type A sorting domain-containing protein [bacterium]|nr:T9SS type A sorting domain-containing protein [bacterium]
MIRLFAACALAAVAGAVLFAVSPHGTPDTDDWTVAEQAQLETALLHAEPGSPRAFKLQTKLDRLEAWRQDQPQPGFPDEFARVLHEMRIPADRTVPEYATGYRKREIERAPISRNLDKAGTWAQRGPGNVAGRARGIVVDPADPTGLTWFIAAVGGGVWWTDDGGVTWSVLTDDLPNLAIQSIAMAMSNQDVLYAGTGESFYNVDTLNGNGLLKSTDRGATWFQVPSTLDDPDFNNVSRILVSPTDPDLVIVSTTTGRYKGDLYPSSSIFRSTDGGTIWTQVHNETGTSGYNVPRVTQLVADPSDFSVQYGTVDTGGILKSTDTGLTWGYINTGITDFSGRFELAVSSVNTDYLYASAEGSSHSELWVSWDAGATWNETVESGSEPNWLGSQGWYDNTIVCHPTDPTIVFVGGPQLYQITLASVGSTSRTTAPLASYWFPHPDHHELQIVQPSVGDWFLLGTNDGGVTRTASGVSTFSTMNLGMTTTQFYGVDKRPGASAYVGGMQDNGTWRSPIGSGQLDLWFDQIGGDGYETSWHFDDPLKIIGGFQFNGLQRSLDGGNTWVSATSGLTDTGSGNAPFITKIGKSNLDPDLLFAVGASGVWRSTDFGGTWNASTLVSGNWGGLSSFHDVRVSRANADVVWAGARMDGSGDIFVSTDGGLNFNPATTYTTVTMGGISGLATHPTNDQTAYALFSFAERPKILRTVDGGSSWSDLSGFGTGTVSTSGFPDVAVYDLLVWPNDTDHIWVGTEIGLVESLDGGVSWALITGGLPRVGVWMLTAVEDEIVVATHGRGIWSYTDPDLETGLTFKPLIEGLVQIPAGDMVIDTNLRSVYDSTQVWIDGAVATTYGPNTRRQMENLNVPVLAPGTRTVHVTGWLDGTPYQSVTKQLNVYAFATPVYEYANDFTNDIQADDLSRYGFVWAQPTGFANGALHSNHPYPDADTGLAMLTVPVKISDQTQLSFDEVVIVEPGDPGTVFGDSGFWDYAVVEGSLDGATWTPVSDGLDCRSDAAWESAYNSSADGDASMYRTRSIDLNQTYARDDIVLLRFRLFADQVVNGWGWAIDNINVVSTGISGVDDTPRPVALHQNYPNPFNPQTTIAFELQQKGKVKLRVFDARGHLVRTLVDGNREVGPHAVIWDGKDSRGRGAAAGVYLYQLRAGDEVRQEKMTLVK